MPGYRNMPEKNAETIIEDGWLLTGDIGEIDEDGYLKIVDRKKELIINAAGKNMSPANIESKLKLIPLVDQAVAVGDSRKYVTAAHPGPGRAAAWAKASEVDPTLAALAGDDELLAGVETGVKEANEALARVEQVQVKRFRSCRRRGSPRRRADPDDEAETPADRRQVRGRDRRALRRLTRRGPTSSLVPVAWARPMAPGHNVQVASKRQIWVGCPDWRRRPRGSADR